MAINGLLGNDIPDWLGDFLLDPQANSLVSYGDTQGFSSGTQGDLSDQWLDDWIGSLSTDNYQQPQQGLFDFGSYRDAYSAWEQQRNAERQAQRLESGLFGDGDGGAPGDPSPSDADTSAAISGAINGIDSNPVSELGMNLTSLAKAIVGTTPIGSLTGMMSDFSSLGLTNPTVQMALDNAFRDTIRPSITEIQRVAQDTRDGIAAARGLGLGAQPNSNPAAPATNTNNPAGQSAPAGPTGVGATGDFGRDGGYGGGNSKGSPNNSGGGPQGGHHF